MTTAEIMFAQPGDAAIDRKQEARKVLWALLAALFIHLLVAFTLAGLGGVFSPALPVEEKPVELTIVDLSTPPPVVPKNPAFMETDESKQSSEAPKEKTFESNANSIAASQQPATGGAPLPSQQGVDRPGVDLETHQYSLPSEGAQSQPSVAPQESPKPTQPPQPTPQPTPVTDSEQFAMLTSTPTPTVQPSVVPTPEQPRSAYHAQKRQTRLSGSITNRGASAVNAIGTPLGRYQKALYDAVGSRWYYYVSRQRDLVTIGTLRLVFSVDRSGRVANLKVVENSSNESFANVCLQSVLEIQLPPIPEDVAETVQTIMSFFVRGGLFMWPLLICSIVSVTTMILRGIALREKVVMPLVIQSEIERLMPGGSPERLGRIVEHDQSSLARIARVALQHLRGPRSANVEAVETRARHEMVRLEKGLIVLEVITGIAPLLGLIGAVSGLVHVFSHLGLSSGASDTRQIALGIAEALNATVFGLSIAVPTLIAFSYFSKKVEVMSV